MEALAALGLASNVAQFLQFTSELISTGSEIAGSVHGALQKAIEIEKVCESLTILSSRLHRSNDASQLPESPVYRTNTNNINDTSENQSHIQSLAELSTDCRVLCDQLLETVRKLQVKGQSLRGLMSFVAALKTSTSPSINPYFPSINVCYLY